MHRNERPQDSEGSSNRGSRGGSVASLGTVFYPSWLFDGPEGGADGLSGQYGCTSERSAARSFFRSRLLPPAR